MCQLHATIYVQVHTNLANMVAVIILWDKGLKNMTIWYMLGTYYIAYIYT